MTDRWIDRMALATALSNIVRHALKMTTTIIIIIIEIVLEAHT